MAGKVTGDLVIGWVIVVILLIRKFGDDIAELCFDPFSLIIGIQGCLRGGALYARNGKGNDRLAAFYRDLRVLATGGGSLRRTLRTAP